MVVDAVSDKLAAERIGIEPRPGGIGK